MRKITLLLVAILMISTLAACGSDNGVSTPESTPDSTAPESTTPEFDVVTKEFGEVKIHTYLSGNISPMVVETADSLVVIDIPGDADTAQYKAFVESLGKPIERIILSHSDTDHWINVDTIFPDVPLYSTSASEISGMEGGEALEITQLSDGTQVIVGVNFDFQTDKELGAFVIKLPEQNVVWFDHLGYLDLHIILPPLDARLQIMKDLQSDGYTWFIAGHGMPGEANAFVSQVETYFADVQAAIDNNDTPEAASAEIIEKYPNYYSKELLDSLLPLHF